MSELSEETKKLIARIAEEHSHSKLFGYLDQEDLKSEIWVICIQALPKYDEDFGPMENFLRKTVKNRLVNRFKDITKSVRSPCPRCKFFDPTNKENTCTKYGEEKYKCNKYKNYQLSIESRNSLLNASEEQFERSYNDNAVDKMINEEMKAVIRKNISKENRNEFERIVSGDRVSKQKIKKLKTEILQILKDNDFLE